MSRKQHFIAQLAILKLHEKGLEDQIKELTGSESHYLLFRARQKLRKVRAEMRKVKRILKDLT